MSHFFRDVRIWFSRHIELADVLGALRLIVALLIAMLFWSQATAIAGALVTAYLVFVVSEVLARVFTRKLKYQEQADVIWGILASLNRQVFLNSEKTRFTLFRPDPLDPRFIIPWFRFRRSGRNAIEEAKESVARYRRGEGETGRAWNKAGSNVIILTVMEEEFRDRSAMETYYIGKLDMPLERLGTISDYMIGVRAILSIPYNDSKERFLGILSIDISMPTKKSEEKFVLDNEGKSIWIDSDHLRLIAETFRAVLESLYSIS